MPNDEGTPSLHHTEGNKEHRDGMPIVSSRRGDSIPNWATLLARF